MATHIESSTAIKEQQYQGHPKDRFGKLSVRKVLNPYNLLKGFFTSNFRDMGNLRPSDLGLTKIENT